MRSEEETAEVELLLIGRPDGHRIFVASDEDEVGKPITLPMGSITIKDTGRKEAGFSIITVAMPQSLAERKGLC